MAVGGVLRQLTSVPHCSLPPTTSPPSSPPASITFSGGRPLIKSRRRCHRLNCLPGDDRPLQRHRHTPAASELPPPTLASPISPTARPPTRPLLHRALANLAPAMSTVVSSPPTNPIWTQPPPSSPRKGGILVRSRSFRPLTRSPARRRRPPPPRPPSSRACANDPTSHSSSNFRTTQPPHQPHPPGRLSSCRAGLMTPTA